MAYNLKYKVEEEYKDLVNDIIKFVTILIVLNLLMFVSNPSENVFLGNTYLKLISKFSDDILIIPIVGSSMEAKLAERTGAKLIICEGQESGGSSAGWQAPIRAGARVNHAKCRGCRKRWGKLLKFEPCCASAPRPRCVPRHAGHAKQSAASRVGPREPAMGEHPAVATLATELERLDGGAVGLRAQCKLVGGHAGRR